MQAQPPTHVPSAHMAQASNVEWSADAPHSAVGGDAAAGSGSYGAYGGNHYPDYGANSSRAIADHTSYGGYIAAAAGMTSTAADVALVHYPAGTVAADADLHAASAGWHAGWRSEPLAAADADATPSSSSSATAAGFAVGESGADMGSSGASVEAADFATLKSAAGAADATGAHNWQLVNGVWVNVHSRASSTGTGASE